MTDHTVNLYFDAAVENGARLLDEKIPRWFNVIDWEILDIYSLSDCIAGQIDSSMGYLHTFAATGLDGYYDCRPYGLEVLRVTTQSDYKELTEAWLRWYEENKQYRNR